MGTHYSKGIFSMKVGNLFMGIRIQIFFLLFQSNGMYLLIITWPGYGIIFGCWSSHISHILVGMQNLTLQLWVFPGNFSDNPVI